MWLWSIHPCFQWYKNYKNLLRNAIIIVENKVAPFLDTVYTILLLPFEDKPKLLDSSKDEKWRSWLLQTKLYTMSNSVRGLIYRINPLPNFTFSRYWAKYMATEISWISVTCVTLLNGLPIILTLYSIIKWFLCRYYTTIRSCTLKACCRWI